jgi:phage repressor protein C with HTH and peptisase S24 domain
VLSHKQIWSAIDGLAARHGHSPSGLAKLAGLDPTTFNRSKRTAANGRLRWPSTESLSKILQVTGASLDEFVGLVTRTGARDAIKLRHLPLIRFDRAAAAFDALGLPQGDGWEEISFPGIDDATAYALEIAGDVLAPIYRDGDIVVVSPQHEVRRGDRVVVRTKRGELLVMELTRRTAKRLDLKSLSARLPDRTLAAGDVVWIARIVWASQ